VNGASLSTMPVVVTIGEPLVALVAARAGPLAEQADFERHVVGAEVNVAVGVARLGISAALVGRVGDDGFGTAILRRLRGEGVDVAGLIVDRAAPTGLLIRERRGVGPASVDYRRAGSAGSRLGPQDVDAAAAAIRGARRLHLTGITPALSATARAAVDRALDIAAASGVPVSLDLNLRRRLWSDVEAAAVLRPVAAHCDLLFGGADEIAAVTGGEPGDDPAALAALGRGLGPPTVIVKRGAQGALALGSSGVPITVPAVPVLAVVDPVGAGDAFVAGVLAALAEGRPLADGLRWGVACGAACVAAVGDLTGLPTRGELEAILAGAEPSSIR
jgi:2-dehydro-3-deoxygluconokinase